MEYLKIPKFENYRNLASYDEDKFVVIEREKPWVKGALPTKFNCYIIENQNDIDWPSRQRPLVSCEFKWGKGTLRQDKETIVGTLGCVSSNQRRRILNFKVNDYQVLTFSVTKEANTFNNYKVAFDGLEYFMVRPETKSHQYKLKYNLINTKRLGKESRNNFALDCQQEKRVFECLKVGDNKLLVSYREPFNVVVAAVLGILRYRGQ